MAGDFKNKKKKNVENDKTIHLKFIYLLKTFIIHDQMI